MVAEPREGGVRGGRRRVTHLRRLDHVAVLVRSTDEALEFYASPAGTARPLVGGHRAAARAAHLPRRGQHVPAVRRAARRRLAVDPVARGARRGPASPVLRRRRRRDRRARSATRASPLCSGTAAATSRASSRRRAATVRIECTEFDRATDVDASPGFLPGEAGTDSQPNDPFGRKGTMTCVS